ncbi:hypothetical protein UMC2_35911 [[Clostridium] sordellii]|uniref:hypothetical protein n=1 Tax=Paraclostridium sordellii TaxID=1505 RepID=UPI0005419BAA|nr:hypothetical protein [Paeniclostridium sordellii]CEK34380.1 hypothetical protein UMC2_35911 [[Clostridium] sordellii] [Paeniclostridium sordellii]
MPKLNSDLLNEEIPTTNKSTIKKDINKNSLDIYDLIKKEKKITKEQVGVTLNKDIVDKLKTVAIDSNLTLSRLFEDLLTPLLENVEINIENVKLYDNKNKLKGRRTKK